MARIARVVVPGFPYHVTHRGNRRASLFFSDDDREIYLALLHEHAQKEGLDIWSWCLMTNHVHLIVIPKHENSMARAIGRAHMRYAWRINRDHGWCGHLWANRYHSSALDWDHLWRAVRYVELNPVRAGMTPRAENHQWSSCRDHAGLRGPQGMLAQDRPFPGHVGAAGWLEWLHLGLGESSAEVLRTNTKTGHPCGSDSFVKEFEERLCRILEKQPVGRPRKLNAAECSTQDLFGEE